VELNVDSTCQSRGERIEDGEVEGKEVVIVVAVNLEWRISRKNLIRKERVIVVGRVHPRALEVIRILDPGSAAMKRRSISGFS
jgi:hypothetical protein